jgi:hypothetical protein
MNNVDWDRTFKGWRCSVGAAPVSSSDDLKLFHSRLAGFVNRGIDYFASSGESVLEITGYLEADEIDAYELLDEFLKQLAVHKYLWETHLDMKDRTTFESGFFVSKAQVLRYVKWQFMIPRKQWKNGGIIKSLRLNYHPVRGLKVEVIYEN